MFVSWTGRVGLSEHWLFRVKLTFGCYSKVIVLLTSHWFNRLFHMAVLHKSFGT